MAINYAEKWSPIVDEKFRKGALTNGLDNYDYDWTGVSTVHVYQIPTVALSNYTLTGSARYGTPSELQNTKSDLTLTQDKAFTFSIDRRSVDDTNGAMEAGAALRREIDEVIIPTIDTYKLGAVVTGCPAANLSTTDTVSASNAYEILLTKQALLDDGLVPREGRIVYCSSAYYKFLKLDNNFIKKGDMAQEIAINGVVGEVDGAFIVPVPTSYLPAKTNFVLAKMGTIPAPIKLMDMKVHDNPPGINGFLIEGRIRYDAFVLPNKAASIAVSQYT